MTASPNATASSPDFEFDALREAKNYRAAILREFRAYLAGNVIEVGAGIGQITAELRSIPSIKKLCSIEPDARFCARILNEFPDHDLTQGTINDLKQRDAWNAILSINVLEHIEDDEAELSSYYELLRQTGGTLCLFVPARPEIYAPIDRDFGHFRRYARPELQNKLRRAGFTVTYLRYYNLVGYFAWWLNFCVLKRRAFQPRAVRLFDRIIFPPTHWAEAHISSPPIGQTLLAIAKAR